MGIFFYCFPGWIRPLFAVLLAAFLLLCLGCGKDGLFDPDEFQEALAEEVALGTERAVRATLEKAGDNAPEIERFLSVYEPDTEKHEAAFFLVANLALADAVSLSSDELQEYVDCAFLARETMPWGKDIPWKIFLQYVLPLRVSQETAQRHRKQFFQELGPLVCNATDIREAALTVNAWCFERSGFKTTSRWDQGPLTTMVRGLGRCEELAILFISAARALSIPARPCYVPRWQHSHDNHLWVEVWAKGGWHYLGAGEVESDFDRAWFSPHLHRAPFFLATAYGNATTGGEFGPAYRQGQGFTAYNRTPAYAASGTLTVIVADSKGQPVPHAEVFVSVYNYAAFHPVARISCDPEGVGRLPLGRGTYLLTVAKDQKTGFAFAGIKAGGGQTVRLRLKKESLPKGGLWMRFDTDPAVFKAQTQIFEHAEAENKSRKEVLENRRKAVFAGYRAVVAKTLEALSLPTKGQAAEALYSAGGNGPAIAKALGRVSRENGDVFLRYVLAMHPKDRAACDAGALAEDVSLALCARKRLKNSGLCEYSDDVFYDYVLCGRVLYEPFSHWRPALAERFSEFAKAKSVFEIAGRVNDLVAGLLEVEAGLLGPGLTPEQGLSAGAVTGKRDRATVAVAVLRSLGIPARALKDYGWMEFFDGDKWLPLYPENPDDLGNTRADGHPCAYYGKPGILKVRFTLRAKAVPEERLGYFQDFTLCRFREKGFFAPLEELRLGYEREKKEVLIQAPAGEYWFVSGRRGKGSQPYVRFEPVLTGPGKILSITRPLDAPEGP
ncbi:MAG: transglutaminase domain-containing protein [Thermodesulfobacteriota bacterium]|nr:transglutaminase domain-containing protein [Thermodesulfobacteriota bacterium]